MSDLVDLRSPDHAWREVMIGGGTEGSLAGTWFGTRLPADALARLEAQGRVASYDTGAEILREGDLLSLDCGAIIDGYDGEDFMVFCPRDFQPFHAQARMAGFTRTNSAFFPLGTDRAPDEYRHDVGVGQPGGRLGFADETTDELRVVSEGRLHHLQRNLPVEPGVDCAIDGGHTAARHLLLDPVPAIEQPADQGVGHR